MDEASKRMFKLAGILVIGALFVVLVGYFISNLGFKITSISPDTSNVSTLTQYFDVSFNKRPDKESVNVTSSPAGTVSRFELNGSRLRIFTKVPMTQSYAHAITVTAKSGSKTVSKTITFTPKGLAFNQLPKDQQKFAVDSQDKGPQNDPIIKNLPHGNLHYTLNYKLVDDSIELEARILLSNADVNSGEAYKQERINKFKQEALDYIHSLGLDASKYKINYVIVQQ